MRSEARSISVSTFCSTKQKVISDRKRLIQKRVGFSHPRRDLQTDTLRTALKLASEDSQLREAYTRSSFGVIRDL